jgi:hypothetical protein
LDGISESQCSRTCLPFLDADGPYSARLVAWSIAFQLTRIAVEEQNPGLAHCMCRRSLAQPRDLVLAIHLW